MQERPDAGMAVAEPAGIPAMPALVTTLRQDLAAVVAGLVLSDHRAQTVGRVTTLTLLTRSMDGRAHVDLLRHRARPAAARRAALSPLTEPTPPAGTASKKLPPAM